MDTLRKYSVLLSVEFIDIKIYYFLNNLFCLIQKFYVKKIQIPTRTIRTFPLSCSLSKCAIYPICNISNAPLQASYVSKFQSWGGSGINSPNNTKLSDIHIKLYNTPIHTYNTRISTHIKEETVSERQVWKSHSHRKLTCGKSDSFVSTRTKLFTELGLARTVLNKNAYTLLLKLRIFGFRGRIRWWICLVQYGANWVRDC